MLVFEELAISGCFLISPKIFKDVRGFFMESYRESYFTDAGIKQKFIQDSFAKSTKGVLRGLHFQKQHPQEKLVQVIAGRILDVIVDIRPDSNTFGQHLTVELDDTDRKQVYIPPGCAHGYHVLSDHAIFNYKFTEYYHPNDEGGIIWDDKDLAIDWQLCGTPTLSERDASWPSWHNIKEDIKQTVQA